MGVYGQTGTPITGSPPAVRVGKTAVQGIVNNTEAAVTWDVEIYDTDAMHDNVTQNSRIVFRTAGLFLVTWALFYATDSDYTLIYSYLRKNGAGFHTAGSNIGSFTDATTGPMTVGSTTDKFAINDYVEVMTNQKNTSAGTNNIQVILTAMSATWVGLGT